MTEQNKQKTKEVSEKMHQKKTPDTTHAKTLVDKTKREGLTRIIVRHSKKALESLRKSLTKAPKLPGSLSFSSSELPRIEKALHLRLKGLDKKSLAYRIKMLTVEDLEKAEKLEAGIGL